MTPDNRKAESREQTKINKSSGKQSMSVESNVKDPGKHYRYTHRQKVTQSDLELGFVDVKMDPYRVCKVYKVEGGPREHIAKKALRGCSKGHTELELIDELQSCLDRWKEMLSEDSQ